MIILKWYSIIVSIIMILIIDNSSIEEGKLMDFVIGNLLILPILIYVILR